MRSVYTIEEWYSENTMDFILTALGLCLVFVGLVGLVIPFLPDVAFISGGILVLLIARDELSIITVLTLIGLSLLALFADWLIVLYSARKMKATREGTIGGLIGVALALSPLSLGFGGVGGLIIFPALGALIGELVGRSQTRRSKALSISLGIGLSVVVSLAIKLILVGLLLAVGLIALGLG